VNNKSTSKKSTPKTGNKKVATSAAKSTPAKKTTAKSVATKPVAAKAPTTVSDKAKGNAKKQKPAQKSAPKTAPKTAQKSGSAKVDATQKLAAELRERQAASDKRSRMLFAGILAGVAVIVVAVIAFMMINNPSSESNVQKKVDQAIENDAGPKSIVAKDGSITISKNGVGEGKAIASLPTVDIFNDFSCPGCGALERSYGSKIEEMIENGVANFRFHPIAFIDNVNPQKGSDGNFTGKTWAYSTRAAAAAFYVAEHAPDTYLAFVTQMYKAGNQPEEGKNYDPQLGSNESIQKRIVAAGASQEIAKAATTGTNFSDIDWNDFPNVPAAKYVSGTVGGPYVAYAQAVTQLQLRQAKFKSTPAVFINDVDWSDNFQKGSSPQDFEAAIKAAGNK
jgi:protein-disulfide isomerase